MIDTMFFLLVFFMLSSLALTKMRSLPVNLPKASTAKPQNVSQETVTVTQNQDVYVDRDLVHLQDLPAAIVAHAGPGADMSKVSVIINSDQRVPYGMVVNCINAARSVGVTHFPLATSGN